MENSQRNPVIQSFSSGVSSCKEPSAKFCQIKKHIPNTLTLFRLATAPLCVWFILQTQLTPAFWVFLASSITDWLDGYLARRWHVTSKLGQILDPLADKALVVSAYITLGIQGYIPLWLAGLILARDALILACSAVILTRHKAASPPAPIFIGKTCAAFQMLFIGLTLIGGALSPLLSPFGDSSLIMVSCLYSVAFITIASGIAYGWVAYQAFQR
jgi:cardiolipin synthase